MLAHLPSLCLPLSKKAQFETAVSEVHLYSKYWQLEAISLKMPVTQFRKYTEILSLTEDAISWLPKYFTAFFFYICPLFQVFHDVSSNNNKKSFIIVLSWWNKRKMGIKFYHKSLFIESNKMSFQRAIDRLYGCIYVTKQKTLFKSLEFEKLTV